MKKDLLKTNVYDVEDTLIIVGSCLDRMHPEAYKELEKISNNIYDVSMVAVSRLNTMAVSFGRVWLAEVSLLFQ